MSFRRTFVKAGSILSSGVATQFASKARAALALTPRNISTTAKSPTFFAKGSLHSWIEQKLLLMSLDGSGTMADAFGLSVLKAFTKLFNKYRITITPDEIRIPMGVKKILHIEQLLQLPTIQLQWRLLYKRISTQKDIEKMHEEFAEIMLKELKDHCELNPGMKEVLLALELELAGNSGFNKAEFDIVVGKAVADNIPIKYSITSCQVPGRDKPDMLVNTLENYRRRNNKIILPRNLLVGDDTRPGIKSAINLRDVYNEEAWKFIMVGYSSDLRINSSEEAQDVSFVDQRRKELLEQHIEENVADYVIMYPQDIPLMIQNINLRLNRGELPGSKATAFISNEDKFHYSRPFYVS